MTAFIQYVLSYIFVSISLGGVFECLGIAALAGICLFAAGVIIRRSL